MENKLHIIRCNNTMKEYSEEDLVLCYDKEDEQYFYGCPCCQDDAYLMDIYIDERVKDMVDRARAIMEQDHTKITHHPMLEHLVVEFDGEDGEYVFSNDSYRELHEEYESSCLYEHLYFEEYIALVSQSW